MWMTYIKLILQHNGYEIIDFAMTDLGLMKFVMTNMKFLDNNRILCQCQDLVASIVHVQLNNGIL
jgi:hypothetical protein